MRALVTGAAGFIGSTLVDRLLSEGHQVVGVDNLITGNPANLAHARKYHARKYNERRPRRFTFVRADILAPELAGIVTGTNPDAVFHLAAQVGLHASVNDPQRDARSNILEALGVSSPARYSAVRTGEVQAIALDPTEAGQELGWKPSIKLIDGIQRTIHWLRGTVESVPTALVDA
jgi:UDP-glucose 4-epimerase